MLFQVQELTKHDSNKIAKFCKPFQLLVAYLSNNTNDPTVGAVASFVFALLAQLRKAGPPMSWGLVDGLVDIMWSRCGPAVCCLHSIILEDMSFVWNPAVAIYVDHGGVSRRQVQKS